MIIGLVGFIGAGKGTVGQFLIDKGFYSDSFAAALKDCVSIIYNWDRDMLEGITKESREWRTKPDEYWSRVYGYPFTPRMALQTFGTDACRNNLHENIWCESLGTRIRGLENVVITDVRFKNEIDYVRQLGGKVVRISRGEHPHWFDYLSQVFDENERRSFMKQFGIHQSEWDWVGEDLDYVIENSGSLECLQARVNELIEKIKTGDNYETIK